MMSIVVDAVAVAVTVIKPPAPVSTVIDEELMAAGFATYTCIGTEAAVIPIPLYTAVCVLWLAVIGKLETTRHPTLFARVAIAL